MTLWQCSQCCSRFGSADREAIRSYTGRSRIPECARKRARAKLCQLYVPEVDLASHALALHLRQHVFRNTIPALAHRVTRVS
jgi:hypothetical protein